jgi:calcineurin-like phosphoesterase family protein
MSKSQNERWEEKYHEWFDEVVDNYEGLWLGDGTVVNLSHFPYEGDSHDGDRYTKFRLEDKGTPLIHGHTHAEYDKLGKAARVSFSKSGTLQIHVGMDAWDYTPVDEARILRLMESANV